MVMMADKNKFDNEIMQGKYDRIAATVKACREELGMTQEQLAEAAGVSANTVSRIERANVKLRMTTAWMLAGCLDLSFNYFLLGSSMEHTERLKMLEKTVITYFDAERQYFGLAIVHRYNETTCALYIESIAIEKTEKDFCGEPKPLPQNQEKLLDRQYVESQRRTYLRRLRGLSDRVFLCDPRQQLFIEGKVIRIEQHKSIIRVEEVLLAQDDKKV